jgi:hypothetical protein
MGAPLSFGPKLKYNVFIVILSKNPGGWAPRWVGPGVFYYYYLFPFSSCRFSFDHTHTHTHTHTPTLCTNPSPPVCVCACVCVCVVHRCIFGYVVVVVVGVPLSLRTLKNIMDLGGTPLLIFL